MIGAMTTRPPAAPSTALSACSAAFEVMRTLNDAGIEILRDVEVGFFNEEEGVRFGTDMLGSAVAAGENGRISHTPREYSNPDACANGTDVLADAVLRLANQP